MGIRRRNMAEMVYKLTSGNNVTLGAAENIDAVRVEYPGRIVDVRATCTNTGTGADPVIELNRTRPGATAATSVKDVVGTITLTQEGGDHKMTSISNAAVAVGDYLELHVNTAGTGASGLAVSAIVSHVHKA